MLVLSSCQVAAIRQPDKHHGIYLNGQITPKDRFVHSPYRRVVEVPAPERAGRTPQLRQGHDEGITSPVTR
jgi:hypothetical protein